jgi:hypothetical protein
MSAGVDLTKLFCVNLLMLKLDHFINAVWKDRVLAIWARTGWFERRGTNLCVDTMMMTLYLFPPTCFEG